MVVAIADRDVAVESKTKKSRSRRGIGKADPSGLTAVAAKEPTDHIVAFQFGVTHPFEGIDAALQTMKARHRLWNVLVTVTRVGYIEQEALIGTKDREERKARWALPEVKEASAEIWKRVREQLKEARKLFIKEAPMYWTNYDQVDTDMDRALSKHGLDLAYHPWLGRGSLFLRWQNGLEIKDLETNTLLRITDLPDEIWCKHHGEKLRARRKMLSFRVGSDAKGHPIWFKAHVTVPPDRPLPENGTIRLACLRWERVGKHNQWSLSIVVRVPEAPPVLPENPRTVAVDVGWRAVRDPETGKRLGLRVAVWHGDDGAEDEVIVPERTLSGLDKVDDIQSIRDQRFDDAKKGLAAFLSTIDVSAYPWLAESVKDLGKWRSQARLAYLLRKWRHNRFEGDETIYTLLTGRWDERLRDYTGWLSKEDHLHEYEDGMRQGILRNRKNIYRQVASDLAKRYDLLVLEKFDLSGSAGAEYYLPEKIIQVHKGQPNLQWKDSLRADIQAHPDEYERFKVRKGDMRPKDYTRFFMLDPKARRYRTRAAPSELTGALINAFKREHGPHAVVRVSAKHATHTCAECGVLETFDAASQVSHYCSNCGELWDIKVNKAKNLLDSSKRKRKDEDTGLAAG